ncbi:CPBP family intramembrane glutamic endopeptidase [Arthrobacter sp. ISL-5]|uniref:CPBP family intramembrane glutamic endopeptidase n=1 Tax=Arthrobacter sp. ISL-5 TaxID=2819111 RepID=UPI001BEC1936|nr:CPBP family intramembrane glutamic endopeptidase [Arthrobacter sp. ISL-5]MBT2554446.1 CPBP family intramembrane metalloprotease [Arthrobacter sp. ISL-5]
MVGVTLKQAAWALMFLALYLAVLTGGILAVGLSGLIDFTPESVILLILCGATAAAMLAVYIHLIRRNGLSLGGLGFRRFRPRMLHLLWQIPSAIVISACLQGLFLAALTILGIDSTSAGASNDTLARIADLPTPFVVLGFLIVAVLTPLWEEVLFRGAFLNGLSRRFRPFLAVVLSAALFAACHLVLLTFAYLFALGTALALVRRFHQNLWAPVLLHAVNNALVLIVVLAAA